MSLLSVIFLSLPFIIVMVLAIMAVAWVGVSLAHPSLSLYVLIGIIVAFSGSNYGQLDLERTIYSRGTGVLHFSILNYFLWGSALVLLIRNAFNPALRHHTFLGKYFIFFGIVIATNAVIAGFSVDKDLHTLDAFTYDGLLNLLNAGVFFFICTNTFKSRDSVWKIGKVVLLAIALRGTFGLIRWAFFGGDSANVYANIEHTNTKLTFFDINDSFLAMVAAFSCAWLLAFRSKFLHLKTYLMLWCLLIMEMLVIIFSFRRSGLLGVTLAAVFLLLILPARQRLWAGFMSMVFLVSGGVVIWTLRLSQIRGGVEGGLLYDIFGSSKSSEGGARFLEYTETWRTLGNDLLWGKGMWGILRSNLSELSYHNGDFGFVHSGFGHILLKSGLIGLIAFLALIFSATAHYVRIRKRLQNEARLFADLGIAGLLFWFPTFLIGTPVVEFRTMMMLGLVLALPYIADQLAQTGNRDAAA